MHCAYPTAHNFATSNTVKILAGRLNRLRKTAFVVNKNLSPAKTTFNCKNGQKIQTRPSLFAKIDPLRLKLFLYRLIANKRAWWPPIFYLLFRYFIYTFILIYIHNSTWNYVGYEMKRASSAIYHLISNVRSWNNWPLQKIP